jgi:asparagine synthetase B (glutamine-hydrolysing)
MPSLAAFVGNSSRNPATVVETMIAAAPHRGSTVKVAGVGRAAVAVGLGDEAGEAVLGSGPGWALAAVGHLDNLEALAGRLGMAGAGATDPAAVLATLISSGGPEAMAQLRGDFAIVFTDGESLIGFRDHAGFRTLFYRHHQGETWAATEPKQVVAGAGLGYRPNLEMLERIFYNRVGRSPETAVEGVHRLPPQTVMKVGDSIGFTRYWNPEQLLERQPLEGNALKARFDQLMDQALERSLTGADGLALSGGIDSPALAAYGAPLYQSRFGRPLPALSAVYPGHPAVDETTYIKLVADHHRMPLHTYEPVARPTDRLEQWVRWLDGPVPVVSLNETYEHLHLARSLGIRNLLTGEMAEFVFDSRDGTFEYLIARGRLGAARNWWRVRRRAGASVRGMLRASAPMLIPVSLRSALRRVFPVPRTTLPAWIDPEVVTRIPIRAVRDRWRRNQVMSQDGPGFGLEADDLVQSIAGVTERRPFADIDLWELFLGLPAEIKYPDPRRKTLVRSLLRGRVPDPILDRQDKTLFDDFVASSIDYEMLERHLSPRGYAMPGIDYDGLRSRLGAQSLGLLEYMWAKDLAAVHAFISTV